MLKEYKRYIPIVEVNYRVVIYDDPVDFQQHFKDTYFEIPPKDFSGGVFEWKDRLYIALRKDDKLTPGVVAHECNHLLNDAFKWVKAEVDTVNDEIQSRFLGFIVDQVHGCLKKYEL